VLAAPPPGSSTSSSSRPVEAWKAAITSSSSSLSSLVSAPATAITAFFTSAVVWLILKKTSHPQTTCKSGDFQPAKPFGGHEQIMGLKNKKAKYKQSRPKLFSAIRFLVGMKIVFS
jgi:hypothetical protein